MSRLNFLEQYAVDGRHYDVHHELDKELNDANDYVRLSAAKHLKATKEHLDKALSDEHERYVRQSVRNNPNYKKYFK